MEYQRPGENDPVWKQRMNGVLPEDKRAEVFAWQFAHNNLPLDLEYVRRLIDMDIIDPEDGPKLFNYYEYYTRDTIT